MLKYIMMLGLWASLAAGTAVAADNCCPNGKCGTCCTESCTHCGDHCTKACCKK